MSVMSGARDLVHARGGNWPVPNPIVDFLMSMAAGLALVTPLYLVFVRGVRSYQLGLHCSHWWRNVLCGLLFYPLVLLHVSVVHGVLTHFFEPVPHQIETVYRESPTRHTFFVLS